MTLFKIPVQEKDLRLLRNHLNISWLRPENVVWDTTASSIISQFEIKPPSLDLGCGNGITSFITAGGSFSLDYDWYINADPQGFWENKDIYDVCKVIPFEDYIAERPYYRYTFGLDHKDSLLRQAKALGFYENLIQHDVNLALPFEEGQLKTVFSNILYWLDSPERALREIHRVLDKDGTVLLCLPNRKFLEYCFTYHWEKEDSPLLRKLNRGRSENMHWVVDYKGFCRLVKGIGFRVVHHQYYLSRLTLTMWDIGLRPLSPVLIKMANTLSPETRRAIKREWMETILDFLIPLYERRSTLREKMAFISLCWRRGEPKWQMCRLSHMVFT